MLDHGRQDNTRRTRDVIEHFTKRVQQKKNAGYNFIRTKREK